MNTNGIPINLLQLQQELIAGGISVPNGLVLSDTDLRAPALDGTINDLPGNAAPIIAAHVPIPPDGIAAKSDLVTQYTNAIQSLDSIIAGTSGLSAQQQAATIARILRATLRLVKDVLT